MDAVHCEELMRLVAGGKLDTNLLISHRGSLNNVMEGYRVFEARENNCLKWVITPYE